MIWLQLVIAGLLETVWAYTMKQSHGFSRLGYSAVTIIAMIVSFWLLSRAMRELPLGTAYVVWTGIGSVGAFLLGLFLLGESASPLRLAAAAMIVGGILLMKASS
ncbi:multidrug efflux SMR transporter [Paracoccus sp. SCSIO 75233]|uniref:DMT family transporter n=1 Tax=Paracoccus sp. SCSIO 75233 TaxID=3017782 RepID=UPI0022F05652|nr:SMR family transporter [Paracoccus sp. SCSIO 75233]WBU52436.1 SMR family transporter [Paracoccus sp. SCSIO 75233]